MRLVDRVRSVIAQTLDIPDDTIGAATVAADLPAWDSVGHVNLMMSIEQAFEVELDVDDFPKLTSVSAIVAYLDAKGVARGSANH